MALLHQAAALQPNLPMYAGDKVRKKSLIDFGFRLPSAYDNRPLKFEEIERFFNDVVFVSATPGDYELKHSDTIVEQFIRPTGLVDPIIEIAPRLNQMNHLVSEIKKTTEKGFRTLVTVLTKKLAEELAHYLEERQIKVCFLHSDLKTPQRTELLQKLRMNCIQQRAKRVALVANTLIKQKAKLQCGGMLPILWHSLTSKSNAS